MDYQFPKGFFWGSAASGPQTEGSIPRDGKKESIWDYWYRKAPQRFFAGVGPDQASEFYTRYPEYIQLMQQSGHNSYRHSIQWSRLIPDGLGEVNPKAVAYYNHLIDSLLEAGIEPFINLYHFDMPMALQKIGGWENRVVVDAYVRYAQICFDLFGDRVHYWFTQNEPIVPVEGGYLYDFHYPCVQDLERAVQVAYHELLASAKAIQAYRALQLEGQIGIILNVTPTYPKDKYNKKDVQAARLADAFFNRSFLDPSVLGKFPHELLEVLKERNLLPKVKADDQKIIQENTIDFLGINYYQPRRVQAKLASERIDLQNPMPEDYFSYYHWPECKMNPYRGWEIYERGLYDILQRLHKEYHNIPCYISENGMGVEEEGRFRNTEGIIDDQYRIEFIKDHLRYLHRAIQEGSNCKGYHLWTCMDNWSWLNAYKNRYGLIEVDLSNPRQLRLKASAYWYHDLCLNNGFSD